MSFLLCLRRRAPLLGLAATALAQAAGPDPLDAAAAVPAPRHASVIADHRRLAEPALAPWKASNDTVGRLGGWRQHGRDAPAPAAAASQPPAVPAHRH